MTPTEFAVQNRSTRKSQDDLSAIAPQRPQRARNYYRIPALSRGTAGLTSAESPATDIVEGNHYFPPDALRRDVFRPSDTRTVCPWKGTADYYTLAVGDQTNPDAAWFYREPKDAARRITGRPAFWNGVRIEEG